MPFFVPLRRPSNLPPLETTIERPVIDLKVKPAVNKFEKSKDVAAFANHLGGTLLVGAHEVDGRLRAYVGIESAHAEIVRDEYSKAVAELCQPRPVVDFEEYETPHDATRRVVVVNVLPSLNLVGVKVLSHMNPDGYGGVSFVYPVRSATDAIYLEPSQLAMYMTPDIRRLAVLLSKIPKGEEINIVRQDVEHSYRMVFDEVLEEDNIVRVLGADGKEHRRIPLDCIATVYEDWVPAIARLRWCLYLKSTYKPQVK